MWKTVLHLDFESNTQKVDFKSAREAAPNKFNYSLPSFNNQKWAIHEEPCYINGKANVRIYLVDAENPENRQMLLRLASSKKGLPCNNWLAHTASGLVQVLNYKFKVVS